MTWSEGDYLRTVTNIAEEAIAEYPGTDGNFTLDDEARREYVSESVDGSEFIIYYSANEIVLQASQNEPDGAEVRAMSAEDADWRTLRTLAAYLAMEADVLAEVDRLIAAQPVA
jgi:hypothetical protein